MNSKRVLSPDSELRHLPATKRHQLAGLLDLNDNWKLLATEVRNPDKPDELLLKATDISLLEEQRKRQGGSPANAFLEHWGTYGRKRHTFSDVIYFLENCGLNRAADLVKSSLELPPLGDHFEDPFFLHTNHPSCNWSDLPEYTSVAGNASQLKPSAPNESLISFTTAHTEDEEVWPSANVSSEQVPVRLCYRDVQLATENFSTKDIWHGGTKLGEGSFGEVFRCNAALLPSSRIAHLKYVAVKRFKQLPMNEHEPKSGQFVSELNTMYRFQHPNLVRLFGYSNDGPFLCIVTEYLENGSLQDFLTRQHRDQGTSTSLTFAHRLQIATDVAKALVYLHNYSVVDREGNQVVTPYIHRDVKSANIFLDDRFGARLGDLGLVRQGSTSNTSTSVVTSNIIGTSVYMPGEAFRGDVSVKTDTFSYGVVLLELLTGMPAFDSSRDDSDIVSYIDEVLGDEFDKLASLESTRRHLCRFIDNASAIVDQQEMAQVLDQKCPDWKHAVALKLIILAKCCIEQRKKNRPTMNEVLEVLKAGDC